jgi:hypothetical protein
MRTIVLVTRDPKRNDSVELPLDDETSEKFIAFMRREFEDFGGIGPQVFDI